MPNPTPGDNFYANLFQSEPTPAELIAEALKPFAVSRWCIVPWDEDKGGDPYTYLVQIVFDFGWEMDFLLVRGQNGLPSVELIQRKMREALP